MRIGYACITLGTKYSTNHTCTLKNASEEKIKELIKLNLYSLKKILQYNVENDIKMFRISSELIPFGSHPINKLEWWKVFEAEFMEIGAYIKENDIRISMHPGQYTIINSPNRDVVQKSIDDLRYHTKVLEALGVGMEGKLIIHVGGVYGDKSSAMDRWINEYLNIDKQVRDRFILENDEKHYSIYDVLSISESSGVPIVYDNLHHEVFRETKQPIDYESILKKVFKTWSGTGVKPKIHYSNQDISKKPGAHSKHIDSIKFMKFYNFVKNHDFDIMLEVKDKEISAIKCSNLVKSKEGIINSTDMEKQWDKYKYWVMERSQLDYLNLRVLMRDKKGDYVEEFYRIVDKAADMPDKEFINAADHVFCYFKDKALRTEKEKYIYMKDEYLLKYNNSDKIKKYLWKLTEKYNVKYLKESYFFI